MGVLAPRDQIVKHNVGMGQIVVAHAPGTLTSVLGSCVGLALYHPRLKVAAFAHIVLPNSHGRGGLAGKFADTAVPEMLRLLAIEGALPNTLIAKIAGGANMFGTVNGPMQIGAQNVEAVREAVIKAELRITAEDVEGTSGRRVTLFCDCGSMQIENVDRESKTI